MKSHNYLKKNPFKCTTQLTGKEVFAWKTEKFRFRLRFSGRYSPFSAEVPSLVNSGWFQGKMRKLALQQIERCCVLQVFPRTLRCAEHSAASAEGPDDQRPGHHPRHSVQEGDDAVATVRRTRVRLR